MNKISLFLVTLVLCLSACDSQQQPPSKKETVSSKKEPATPARVQATSPAEPMQLLQDSIDAQLRETPLQALETWRQHTAQQPTLLLFSRAPSLQPIPDKLLSKSIELIQKGSSAVLAAQTTVNSSNPTLLPRMALTAALRAGLFSKVVWVYPTSVSLEKLDANSFRQQLIDSGTATEEEAHSFTLYEGGFSGKIKGVPFDAVHPSAILKASNIKGPIITHLDLGFFGPLYKDEIKTPLYPLLYSFFKELRNLELKVEAVTLSYSNLTNDLPLATRFLGPDITTILKTPQLLDEPFPVLWKQRTNTLYLPNFFQTDEVRKIYLNMETTHPTDPSVKYGLYQVSRDLKDATKALEYLQQAVSIDPVYALEYLQLFSVAKERNRPQQALKMLRLAEEALPDNPFISLRSAVFLSEIKHSEQAHAILAKLLELNWSAVYFPEMTAQLEAMTTAAQKKD